MTINAVELHDLAVEVAADQDEDVDARLQAYIVLLLESIFQQGVVKP